MKRTVIAMILVMMGCPVAVAASDNEAVACKNARGQGSPEEQERRENECLKKLALEKCKGEPAGENKRKCVSTWMKKQTPSS